MKAVPWTPARSPTSWLHGALRRTREAPDGRSRPTATPGGWRTDRGWPRAASARCHGVPRRFTAFDDVSGRCAPRRVNGVVSALRTPNAARVPPLGFPRVRFRRCVRRDLGGVCSILFAEQGFRAIFRASKEGLEQGTVSVHPTGTCCLTVPAILVPPGLIPHPSCPVVRPAQRRSTKGVRAVSDGI